MNNETKTTLEITSKISPILATEEKINKIKAEKPVLNPEIYITKYTSPISTAIQKAIDDDKQGMFYQREDGGIEQRGIVKYKDRKTEASIIFRNFFNNIEPKQFKDAYKDLSVRSCGKYTVFTKKVFAFAEGKLFEQYEATGGNTAVIFPDEEICTAMGTSQSYYSQRIEDTLKALNDILVSLKERGRSKKKGERDLLELPPIITVGHSNAQTLIEFHRIYPIHLKAWGYTQYVKNLLKTDDLHYKYAFDMGQYICELAREKRTEFKVRSIYERVQKLPRIEAIKSNRGSIDYKLFQPFENNRRHLNKICEGVFQLNYKGYENTKDDAPLFLNEKGKFDEELWLETMMTVEWNQQVKPNYDKLFNSRDKYAKQIEAPKRRKRKTKKEEAGE